MSLPSAEVAADFRDALNDLKSNSRPEISNLTIIAKENTEYAQAISRELEEHIKATRPEHKLPALYVLDSIVKNVGTPYTVYLARNLYSTFVNAYTLVDNPTRKALEGLLRTWKQSVPESVDTRPVFPVDITRAIDNMLLKYKTAIAQQQQNQPRAASQFTGQDMQIIGLPVVSGSIARYPLTQNGISSHPPPTTARQSPVPITSPSYGIPSQGYRGSPAQGETPLSPAAAVSTMATVQAEVERLVADARLHFADSPYDTGRQQRLKTFLDLQQTLKRNSLSTEQLREVEQQLVTIDGSVLAQPVPVANPTFVTSALSHHLPLVPTPAPQPSGGVSASTFPPIHVPLLADILRGLGTAALSPRSTPAPPPPTHTQPAVPENNPSSLLQALGLKGLFGSGLAPMSASASPAPPTNPTSSRADVELTKESLKRSHGSLVHLLYAARPVQCSTCGRRFPNTDEGTVMKRKHLDWHFRVKDPNLAKQAIHRSWYICQQEWIEYREHDEAKPHLDANGSLAASSKTRQARWVRIPLNAELVNAPCPVCQERFTPSRLDDEFVWMDTIYVGLRYFHASCYEEAYGSCRNTTVSILGKRVANEGSNTPSKKMQV